VDECKAPPPPTTVPSRSMRRAERAPSQSKCAHPKLLPTSSIGGAKCTRDSNAVFVQVMLDVSSVTKESEELSEWPLCNGAS